MDTIKLKEICHALSDYIWEIEFNSPEKQKLAISQKSYYKIIHKSLSTLINVCFDLPFTEIAQGQHELDSNSSLHIVRKSCHDSKIEKKDEDIRELNFSVIKLFFHIANYFFEQHSSSALKCYLLEKGGGRKLKTLKVILSQNTVDVSGLNINGFRNKPVDPELYEYIKLNIVFNNEAESPKIDQKPAIDNQPTSPQHIVIEVKQFENRAQPSDIFEALSYMSPKRRKLSLFILATSFCGLSLTLSFSCVMLYFQGRKYMPERNVIPFLYIAGYGVIFAITCILFMVFYERIAKFANKQSSALEKRITTSKWYKYLKNTFED